MRELTVRIVFHQPCLGNEKGKDGRFLLPRNPEGKIIFLSTWHDLNMKYAAQVLGRHQDEVQKISWDIAVDGNTQRDCWFRRYYRAANSKPRYCLHEALHPSQIVGINCVVPSPISEDDFWQLMNIAGTYKGLSPYRPGTYGLFRVVSVRPRRIIAVDTMALNEVEALSTQTKRAD